MKKLVALIALIVGLVVGYIVGDLTPTEVVVAAPICAESVQQSSEIRDVYEAPSDEAPLITGSVPRPAEVTVTRTNVESPSPTIVAPTPEPTATTPPVDIVVTATPKNNNGHGNNIDGVDSSNPGKGKQHKADTDPTVDDEKTKKEKKEKK